MVVCALDDKVFTGKHFVVDTEKKILVPVICFGSLGLTGYTPSHKKDALWYRCQNP